MAFECIYGCLVNDGRNTILGRFICTMLSTCKLHSAIHLCDAVYLYLRTVNQIVAEGNSDYRDGRLIRNRTIGQRFAGRSSEI